MGYIKVAYRNIFRQLDYYTNFPVGWDKFVNKNAKYHNLIIKSSKKKCHCTNCNYDFISSKKVNEEIRCPNCHNKYLIKRSNLHFYEFKDYLSILDILDNILVIRYFELKTIIDEKHEHHSSVVEFAREIITNKYGRSIYVNVSKCQGHIHIYHHNNEYVNDKKWREYVRYYSIIDFSIVFPNNIKKVLKNTKFKYSHIWDLVRNSVYIDLSKLLKYKDGCEINKIEFLAKMKLYNLALKTNELNNEGNFQEVFGVSKDYYPFMKKYNITYTQLKILRLLKEKNIKKIRYLERYVNYKDNTDDLEEIANYISLDRFIKYSKMHHKKVKTYLYKDYLRFAKIIGLDLKNNKYAFPKNLKAEHDKLEEQIEIQNNKIIEQAISKRSKELSINKYNNDKFVILPAPNLESLQDESIQQNNCVRTYAEKYASGMSDIYFMREAKKPKKSLVTVEVKNNKIIQSRIKNNEDPSESQMQFLNKWENTVLNKVA